MYKLIGLLIILLLVFQDMACRKADENNRRAVITDLYFKGVADGLQKDITVAYNQIWDQDKKRFNAHSGYDNGGYSFYDYRRINFTISSVIFDYNVNHSLFIQIIDTVQKHPQLSELPGWLKVGNYSYSEMDSSKRYWLTPGVKISYGDIFPGGSVGGVYQSYFIKQHGSNFAITKIEPLPNDTSFQFIIEAEFNAILYDVYKRDSLPIKGKFRSVMLPRK